MVRESPHLAPISRPHAREPPRQHATPRTMAHGATQPPIASDGAVRAIQRHIDFLTKGTAK
jgi:hypothetical protein